jgi:hypothetical protein
MASGFVLDGRRVLRNGAPGGTRTPDPLIRSQMLYPAELQARVLGF